MKQPLTGHDRIHADIIIERIRELGFRFERRRLLQRITEEASVQKRRSARRSWLTRSRRQNNVRDSLNARPHESARKHGLRKRAVVLQRSGE